MFNEDHENLKISRYKFAQVLKTINHGILDIVIEGYDVKLPWNLGKIGIRALKPRSLKSSPKDYHGTKLLKQQYPDKNYIAYHNNDHTNGKIVKPLWLKEGRILINKQFYTLHFTRPKMRELAARLKNPDIANNYYEFIPWKDRLKEKK